ncbi:(-)-alpha-terpineol synthase [Sesamum alatum]|uniref:(-)-alpha-terpineol synthase n=1 Tax=Sesamum alatum TaxID=300844 RepID=A0AAE1YY14_9LAMI|nr:(-)-alpha-terpineol synthase [Sesamum alatum]
MAAITIAMNMIPNKPTSYRLGRKPSKVVCCIASTAAAVTGTDQPCSVQQKQNPPRRSGNYGPPFWDFNYFQSLNSDYKEERYLRRASELKVQVKKMLVEKEMSSVEELEVVDDLQRLGISYHFEDEINQILACVYDQKYGKNISQGIKERDLYSTALEFRLLRQHGFNVPQEVFNCFKNEKGDFNPSLGNDTRGLLQLYEASFVSTPGEKTIDLARGFATNFLQKNPNKKIDENLSLLVRHTLELPIHWRVRRPNARWFIEAYERRSDLNSLVLEFAKLDFNIVQAIHQEEFKHLSRWWKQTGIIEKLPFARDRMVECYFWNTGVFSHPRYGYPRIMASKLNALVTVIDDIFDIYGTHHELQLFNNAIQRWDVKAIEELPNYMKICYLALYNFINEMAYDVLKQHGLLIIPHLRKSWEDLCKTYLQEAEWYSRGYAPTFEEYIDNAWISISAPVILSHAYFLVANPIQNEVVRSLYKYHSIVRYSAMILRLANDLETSPDEMKRGDVPKSIECYMNESGATKEEAREYIRFVIGETWKKMNEEAFAVNSPFPQDFVRIATDLVEKVIHLLFQFFKMKNINMI